MTTRWRRFKKIFSTEKRISGKAAQVEDIKKSLQSAELCVKKTNVSLAELSERTDILFSKRLTMSILFYLVRSIFRQP